MARSLRLKMRVTSNLLILIRVIIRILWLRPKMRSTSNLLLLLFLITIITDRRSHLSTYILRNLQ